MYQQPQSSGPGSSEGHVAIPGVVAPAASYPYYQANYAATAAAPIAAPGALSYYSFNNAPTSQRPPEAVPPPAEPTVTPAVAEKAIKKLVTLELKNAGFEKAEPMCVKQLELEVHACEFE